MAENPVPELGRRNDDGEMPECSLPGVPLSSGFESVHGGRRRRVELSPEARQRVLDKMRSVDGARRRAMEDGHGFVIG